MIERVVSAPSYLSSGRASYWMIVTSSLNSMFTDCILVIGISSHISPALVQNLYDQSAFLKAI